MADLLDAVDAETSTPHSSWDWLRLGHTSGHRAAEIVAGLRANTFPSPESQALSSRTGRWFGQVLAGLTGDQAVANATGGRHLCLTRLAEDALTAMSHPQLIVELAAGFSARGVYLAQQFPESQVVEVDLPDVIETKRRRVGGWLKEQTPTNLRWLSADLSEVPLQDLFGMQRPDLVLAEGVLPYFPHDWITDLAAAVRATLSKQGVLIADVVSSQGWRRIEGQSGLATRLLKRQVGQFKGGVEDAAQARQLFERAGYTEVQVYSLQDLAHTLFSHLSIADVSFLVVAR